MTACNNAQGDYVVLASEPVCIVGVDVAAPQQIRAARPAAGGVKRASSMEDLQQTFQRQFTALEVCSPSGISPVVARGLWTKRVDCVLVHELPVMCVLSILFWQWLWVLQCSLS